MTANAKIRSKLFPIYSKNLSFYRPELAGKFLCPVCLNDFSDSLRLALAHVIPESIGGKITTLVCSKCDSIVGHKYDKHLAREKEYFDDLKDPTSTYFLFQPTRNKGIKVVADFSGMHEPNPHMDFSVPSKTPLDTWRKYFSENGPGNTLEFSLESASQAIDLRKRNLSIIYASFLMMFYQFGYEYILSEGGNYIRQAIIDESLPINFRNAINYMEWDVMSEPFSLPTLAVTRMSKDLCFMTVLIPFDNKSGYVVQLPGFGAKGKTTYENFLQITHPTYTPDIKVMPNNIFYKLLDNPSGKNVGDIIYKQIVGLPLSASHTPVSSEVKESPHSG